jgi:hypothetical protein
VAERSNASVLKTEVAQAIGGSNPSLSATFSHRTGSHDVATRRTERDGIGDGLIGTKADVVDPEPVHFAPRRKESHCVVR